MERVKLHLPETFRFSTNIRIRITDLNYGGHVGNDSFLSLIHEARQQYLRSFGFAELDFAGVGLIMADVAIEYKQELNYLDEIRISVAATNFDRLGFDLFYLLEKLDDGATTVAGKAKTGMVCFDYAARKKVPIPEIALQRLSGKQ